MKLLSKEEIFPFLKNLFSQAQKSIKISSPWIKSEVFEKLLPQKNVNLEVILRDSEIEDLLITDIDVLSIIQQLKGKILLNPDVHSKFVIVDDKKAVVGSANITKSGLYQNRNIETAVFIEDEKEIQKLISQFESIKEKSVNLSENIVGIVLNSVSSITAEILLFQEIPQQTYLKIPVEDSGFLLGRVSVIKDINSSLFSTFLSTVERSFFSETEKLKIILTEKDPLYKKALTLSYLNEKGNSIKVGQLEILVYFNPEASNKESVLKTPMVPPPAGALVYSLKTEKEIQNIMKINHAGYPMGEPVLFGKLFNTNIDAYIDLEKIYSMHMAVLGTTGSGKTTFVRRVMENLKAKDVKIYIFDLYDEYKRSVSKCFKLTFPPLLFPVSFDNIKELFKQYGIFFQEKSSEERRVASYFRRNLKPDIEIIGFNKKSLEDMLIESISLTDLKGELREELLTFLDMLKKDYTEDALKKHPEVVEDIKRSFKSRENTVIYDFHRIEDPVTRVNIAGILMKEIFRISKSKEGKRVIVLEEAQNFAPEKGFGEIPSGSSNIAYVMARKIATEGRKFNLGLIAITQRPANISKYVLSQLNTQAVFKLINRNDLEAVSVFFEYSKEDIFNILPFLKPGNGFITGLAVPFGILTEIELG
ncbi:MAG: DUF87 domain-containing protein [Persephonella sp.]|nr:DUF87 domain-containing protein [Persephonella sp.]